MDAVLKSKISSPNEWAVSIGKSGSTYFVSAPLEGSSGSGSIPPVPSGDFYAHGHSHPNNSSGVPSSGDLYNFLEQAKNITTLQTMYVYGSGWNGSTEVYAINVSDRAAISAFLTQYPKSSNWTGSFSNSFAGDVQIAYQAAYAMYNSGQYNNNGATYPYYIDAVALSYIMSQLNMGVTFSRKVDNASFNIISAMKQTSGGNTILNINTCN